MASRREQMSGARSRSTRSSLLLGQPHPDDPSPHHHRTDHHDGTAAATTPRRRGSSSNNHGRLSRTGSGGRRMHRRTGSEVLRDFERRSYGADVVPDPPSILDWRENDGGGSTAEPPGAAGDERRRLFAAAGGASSSAVTEVGGAGGRRDVLLPVSGGATDDTLSHGDGDPSSVVHRPPVSLPPAANIHLLSTPRAGSGGGRRWPKDSNNSNGARTGSRRSLVSDIPSRTGDDFSLEWSLEDGDGDENDDSDNWGDEDDEDGIDRYHQFMHGQQRQRSQRTIGSLPDEDDDEYMTAYRLRLRRMLDSEGDDEDDDDEDGTGNGKMRRARRRETARRRTRLLALTVLAIAVTAISMALRSHKDRSSAPVPDLVEQADTGPGRAVIPDRHDEDPAEEEQWLLELLVQYTSVEVLRNSTSPQARSMRWLLRSSDDDGSGGDSGGSSSGSVIDPFFRAYVRDGPVAAKKIAFEGSLLTHAVLERYALVTLYYATNGDGGRGDGGYVHGVGGTAQSGGPVVVDDAESASSLRTKKGAVGGTNKVGSGGWRDESMWLSPYHHCEWAGVVCSLGKGYRKEITELRLSDNGLRGGPLPSELGALDRLESLHLGGGNDIMGTLPTEGLFDRLTRLREVRLEGNGLTGPLPIDIGGGWSPLEGDGEDGGTGTHYGRALEVLDLTNNRISGQLPPSLGKLHKLSALRLSNNRLGGDLGDVLSVLRGLDTLEVLLLDGNDIGGSIPESIGSLPSLRRLRLANNALVDSVPPSVGELGNLLELDLSRNRLDGTIPVGGDEGGGSATGLDGLTSLETLSLSGNAFHGRLFESSLFADDHHRPHGLSELRRLRLDGNAFSGTIAPWISGENLVALEELYVSDNSFSGEVPDELGSLTTLRELALEGNDMVGSVPESLCRLHLRLLSADCGDGGGGGGDDGSTMTCSCCTECVG